MGIEKETVAKFPAGQISKQISLNPTGIAPIFDRVYRNSLLEQIKPKPRLTFTPTDFKIAIKLINCDFFCPSKSKYHCYTVIIN